MSTNSHVADHLKEFGENERYLNRHLWSDGIKSGGIYRRLAVQHNDKHMNQEEVYEYVADIHRWENVELAV
jgi:hypothetical protein